MRVGRIAGSLEELLAQGVSIVVATRDASLVPHVTRASGLRVEEPDRLLVLLPRASSAPSR